MRHIIKINLMILMAIVVISSSLLTAGKAAAQTSTNIYCPVTTDEKANPNIYVDYKGQRIQLCCNDCKRKFLADPEKYIGNLNLTGSDTYAGMQGDSLKAPAIQNNTEEIDEADSSLSTVTVAEHEHDHDADHDSKPGLITFLGKLHPAVVHFPIALVIMSLIFVILRFFINSELLDKMTITMMYWAGFFAIIAALLGLARAYGSEFPSYLIEYFKWHRLLGLLSTALTIVTAVVGYFWQKHKSHKAKILFRVLIVITAIAIGITGHLGATLVFGPDYFG